MESHEADSFGRYRVQCALLDVLEVIDDERAVVVSRSRSMFQVPAMSPSASDGASHGTSHARPHARSSTKRLRSACDNSALSYSGKKRGGAGVSGSGRGASGRSNSSRPRSSRNGRSRGRRPLDHLAQAGQSLTRPRRRRPTPARRRAGSARRPRRSTAWPRADDPTTLRQWST